MDADPFTVGALFADRREAGGALGLALERERSPDLVVVGLARGGVVVAAEIARTLDAPLDVVAVRKVGHPLQPEYGLGAVTPGEGIYLRDRDGLTDTQLDAAVHEAQRRAAQLDRRLHTGVPPLDLSGKTVILVDDGLATGGTMIAALRWSRATGAARVVAAVPVAPASSAGRIAAEADAFVCLHHPETFFAVGLFYRFFPAVDDEVLLRLLRENRREIEGHLALVPAAPATRGE